MIQKLPRLYKVERHGFDFVLAENSNEAKSTDLDIKLETTVTEITEMSPKDEGYSWKPRDAWGIGQKKGAESGSNGLQNNVVRKKIRNNLLSLH